MVTRTINTTSEEKQDLVSMSTALVRRYVILPSVLFMSNTGNRGVGREGGTDGEGFVCVIRLVRIRVLLYRRHLSIAIPSLTPPNGGRGMSDVSLLSGISGLLFDATFLIPLLFLCLLLLLFLSCLFSFFLVMTPCPDFLPRKVCNIFR